MLMTFRCISMVAFHPRHLREIRTCLQRFPLGLDGSRTTVVLALRSYSRTKVAHRRHTTELARRSYSQVVPLKVDANLGWTQIEKCKRRPHDK